MERNWKHELPRLKSILKKKTEELNSILLEVNEMIEIIAKEKHLLNISSASYVLSKKAQNAFYLQENVNKLSDEIKLGESILVTA